MTARAASKKTAAKARTRGGEAIGPDGLTNKQRVFAEAYLTHWNATRAAREADYAHPNQQGPRLLVNVGIRKVIEQRLSEMGMSANEVLARLANHARADLGDYVDGHGNLDIESMKDDGATGLIKKLKHRQWTDKDGNTTDTVEVELHDPQAALVHIGRYHKLFVDRSEITGKNGGPIELDDIQARLLSRFAQGDAASGAGSVPGPAESG